MNGNSENSPRKCIAPKHARRKSKIYNLFHHKSIQRSRAPKKRRRRRRRRRKSHRSASTISQFDKLKSLISNLFPKKTVRVKPKKRNKKRRRNSFTFRKKKKKKQLQLKQTHSCHLDMKSRPWRSEHNEYKSFKPKTNQPRTPTDVSISISETEEYKEYSLEDETPRVKPRLSLATKSASCMKSFEKRPEYVTYYPPDSLMEAFNNMSIVTVNEQYEEEDISDIIAVKTRHDEVDQIFELASRTLDYCNFYGYSSDNRSGESELNESSLCSFIDVEYLDTLSWK
eukprot:54095_1